MLLRLQLLAATVAAVVAVAGAVAAVVAVVGAVAAVAAFAAAVAAVATVAADAETPGLLSGSFKLIKSPIPNNHLKIVFKEIYIFTYRSPQDFKTVTLINLGEK